MKKENDIQTPGMCFSDKCKICKDPGNKKIPPGICEWCEEKIFDIVEAWGGIVISKRLSSEYRIRSRISWNLNFDNFVWDNGFVWDNPVLGNKKPTPKGGQDVKT